MKLASRVLHGDFEPVCILQRSKNDDEKRYFLKYFSFLKHNTKLTQFLYLYIWHFYEIYLFIFKVGQTRYTEIMSNVDVETMKNMQEFITV